MNKSIQACLLTLLVSVTFLLTGCRTTGSLGGQVEPINFPKFPWPPPKATHLWTIPRNIVKLPPKDRLFIGDVDEKLVKALDSTGYVDKSYFYVKDGFALVTRMEQICEDGTSKEEDRWNVAFEPMKEFSLLDYLSALFHERTGLYRIIVFVVTPAPFNMSQNPISASEANAWLKTGFNKLPSSVAGMPYTSEYSITALVYEFKKPENENAVMLETDQLTGQIHLQKAGILTQLGKKI